MNIRHLSRIALIGLLLGSVAGTAAANESGRGGGGGHSGGAHFSASHFAGRTHFAGPGAAHFSSAAHFNGAAQFAGPGRGAGVARYGARGFAPGASSSLRYRGWRGGYWRGGYWPAAYYGPGFVWFLAALPAFCTSYWFDGAPYYYYDNVYYQWSPSAVGYVATDPPPVADGGDSGGAIDDSAGQDVTAPAADADTASAGQSGPVADTNDALTTATGDVYAYPSGNQSPEQQRTDRSECSSWAISQVTANGATASPSDARRAMIACLDGRGYSAN